MEFPNQRSALASPNSPRNAISISTDDLVPHAIMTSGEPAGTSPLCISSGANAESFNDSGYNTQATSPNGKASESAKSSWYRSSPISSLFGKKEIKLIAREVDELALERFRAIQPDFEQFLLGQIRAHRRPGVRFTPMSIRVAMMGTSDEDARPYIVVLCEASLKPLIQGFIRQDVIANLCEPGELGVPSFKIVVHGNAPRLRFSESDIDVVADTTCVYGRSCENTFCGIPISFRLPDGTRQHATFGGIIKVTTVSGDIELLGMTAGHVLHQSDDDSKRTSAIESASIRDDQSDALFPEEFQFHGHDVQRTVIYEDDDDIEVDIEPHTPSESSASILTSSARWDFKHTTALGNIIDVTKSSEQRNPRHNYDWALFRLTAYAMNYARSSEGRKELRNVSRRLPGTSGKRSIRMLSGSKGRRRGTLLSEPSRILLDGSEEFADSFMITINGKQGICDGDSGSWVVDAETFEIYGQLVASDDLGSGYVIPMTGIMDDIKSQLGAKSVGLPGPSLILYASTIVMEDARRLARKRLLSFNVYSWLAYRPSSLETIDPAILPPSVSNSSLSSDTLTLCDEEFDALTLCDGDFNSLPDYEILMRCLAVNQRLVRDLMEKEMFVKAEWLQRKGIDLMKEISRIPSQATFAYEQLANMEADLAAITLQCNSAKINRKSIEAYAHRRFLTSTEGR